MRLGKKTRVTKEITRQEKNRRNNLRRITISAAVGFILFICLIVIQSSILNQEQKLKVYQVSKDINTGDRITETNIGDYLTLKEVQVSLIPEGYITDSKDIVNKFVNRNYKVNDIITIDGITDTEKLYKDSLKNPNEVSFNIAELGLAVSGTIREGDYINIYGLRKPEVDANEFGVSQSSLYEVDKYYTFKHVYIDKAFTGTGKRISSETDDGTAATLFNIILSEKDIEMFNEMMKNCDVRIAKLMYNTEANYTEFITETNKNTGASVSNNVKQESNQSDGYFWEEETNLADELLNGVQPGTTEPVDTTAIIDEQNKEKEELENTENTENTEQTNNENVNTENTDVQNVAQPTQ